MEYLDILDENGAATGEKKEKSAVHRDGDWHRSVHVWIVNSAGEVLIQKRAGGKLTWPGLWDISAAGHVDAGEDPLAAAVRETEEELGIRMAPAEFRRLFTIKQGLAYGAYVEHEFDDVCLLKTELDPAEVVKNKREVAEIKFVPLEELQAMVGGPLLVPHDEEYYQKLFSSIKTLIP